MPNFKMIANKGLLQIFFALLLVVTIMFISNYIVFKNSISGIYDQVSENNKLVVKNMIQSFDRSFKDINDIIFSINMLPYEAWDASGKADMSNVYMIQKNLAKMTSSIDYIEEVVVFNTASSLAITTEGTSDLNELINQKYRHKLYNADFWKSYASSKHPMRIFPAEDYSQAAAPFGEQTRKLHVVLGNNQLSTLNVMIFINADKLLRHVNQTAMMQGTSIIVLDQDRNVILSTEQNWDIVGALKDLAVTEAGSSLKRKDYEFDFFKSDYNDYIYIDKIPYKFQNVKTVTDANRLIMLTAIVAALILSVMLTFYLYRPVKDILKLFGGRGGWADFRSIQAGIRKIQEENEAYKTQMDFIDSEMRRGVLMHALDEYSHSREFEIRTQRYFSDMFRDRNFMLTAFYVQPHKAKGETAAPKADEVYDFLSARLQSSFTGTVLYHAGRLQFLALVGVHHGAERDSVLKEIRKLVRQTENEGTYDVLAVVGRAYTSKIQNCHLAYQDIIDGMTYRNAGNADHVIDVQAIRHSRKIYFPTDLVEKLSNCLSSGDETECIRIIHHLMDKNEELSVPFNKLVPIAKCLLFYVFQHMDEDGQSEVNDYRDWERKASSAIENAFDSAAIRDELVQAAQMVAKSYNNGQKRKLDQQAISRYIEQNYMHNLDLNHMADRLETSPKYFSNYFKKTFGVNFVEYLNKVRLAQAKKMLLHTNASVAEIGESTGYLNSSTFTSTFKKYYGISPSEYRKKHEPSVMELRRKTK
ncbi:helix-turn-helix transcriptional regulator [Gordoniibacillus kamchatkensis]|uniref:helix-turn-helix transcriptional regulator n=1 Tax=Gordoniibacillus kamchatkensis TaxID=1590651 RepID=UPI000698A9F9|nr:AraC family transcriptional regulator [Paenibacillus sp. VKM B-2647]